MINAKFQEKDIILTSTNHNKQIRVYHCNGRHYFENTDKSVIHIGGYHKGKEKLKKRGW